MELESPLSIARPNHLPDVDTSFSNLPESARSNSQNFEIANFEEVRMTN